MHVRIRFYPIVLVLAGMGSILVQCPAFGAEGLRAAFVVQGKLGGEDISGPEQRMAARKLEGMLQGKFRALLGLKNFDQAILTKAQQDKEKWAALTGGGVSEVQKILAEHKLDALVRAYYRTAPAFKTKDKDGNEIFLGTAMLTVEILSFKTGEKAVLAWSPPMGALDAGSLHKPQQGADAFEAGLAALAYATDRVVEQLQKDPAFAALTGHATKVAPPAKDALRVIFMMEQGRIKGKGVGPTENRVGAMRLEATLASKLKTAVGIHSFDDSVLKKVKQDAEQWAILQGDDVAAVQKVLKQHGLDALIRVYFRTAPAYRKSVDDNVIYSGTASVMSEIISLKTGEKGVLIESPPMGTVEHPARRALDPFDASMSALDYATDKMIEQLRESPSIRILKEQKAEPGPEANAEKPAEDAQRVLFVLRGTIAGQDILPSEQRVGAMHLESIFDRKIKQALRLKNFDERTLKKVKQQAEEWAVLLGGDVDEVQKVLEKHNVDALVQVDYKTDVNFSERDKDGNAVYTAMARVNTDIVSRKNKEKKMSFRSPPMGKSAIDPFDAGLGALDLATNLMMEKLYADMGVTRLMAGPKTTPATPQPKALGKPTVAVLWVRPSSSFRPWFGGRTSRLGGNRKKRQQIKAFCEHMKSTSSIGIEVAHYLVQGIVASGALIPVEQSGKTKEEIAGIQNKLVEYRMAGWVGDKLPFSDAIQAGKNVGADYVVTALLHKIYEKAAGASLVLMSGGKTEAVAEVEVTVTHVQSGRTQTYKSQGSFSKSGYGTIMAFEPQGMKLDKMLIGGAIKEAVYLAAKKIQPF